MPDLTQTFLDFPLWLWVIGIVAIFLIAILVARTHEYEGFQITGTPPFIVPRLKRKSVSVEPTDPKPARSIGNVTTGDKPQIS